MLFRPQISRQVKQHKVLFLALLVGGLIFSGCRPPVAPAEVAELRATPVLATFTPTPPPTSTPTPRPTATPTPRPTATPTALSDAQTTAGSAEDAGRFTAVITEQQVNALARQALSQQQDISISNVRVDLKPGRIIFSGRVVLAILPVDIEIIASITAVDGKPVPQIVSVKAGGNEVGGFLRQQVDSLLEPYLTMLAETDLNVYIDSVTITEDEIRLQGWYID
jgi:hypothetical protein